MLRRRAMILWLIRRFSCWWNCLFVYHLIFWFYVGASPFSHLCFSIVRYVFYTPKMVLNLIFIYLFIIFIYFKKMTTGGHGYSLLPGAGKTHKYISTSSCPQVWLPHQQRRVLNPRPIVVLNLIFIQLILLPLMSSALILALQKKDDRKYMGKSGKLQRLLINSLHIYNPIIPLPLNCIRIRDPDERWKERK